MARDMTSLGRKRRDEDAEWPCYGDPSPRPFPWLCQCGEVSTDNLDPSGESGIEVSCSSPTVAGRKD